jgi:hypothetical protein
MATKTIWDPNCKPTANTRKTRATKEVVNPVFKEMLPYVTDPHWRDTLQNAALGKFAKTFSFGKDILTCKKGKKTFTLMMEKDVVANMVNVQQFITAHSDVADSPGTPLEEKPRATDHYQALSDVRSRRIVLGMLGRHVARLVEQHHLDSRQRAILRSVLLTSLELGRLNTKEIPLANSEIVEIKGLHYLGEGRWSLDNAPIKKKATRAPPPRVKDYYYERWMMLVGGASKNITTDRMTDSVA